MRQIDWRVVITDDNKIGMVENTIGFQQTSVESHLEIIGILENMKQKHLDKLNTLFEKTIKKTAIQDKDLDL